MLIRLFRWEPSSKLPYHYSPSTRWETTKDLRQAVNCDITYPQLRYFTGFYILDSIRGWKSNCMRPSLRNIKKRYKGRYLVRIGRFEPSSQYWFGSLARQTYISIFSQIYSKIWLIFIYLLPFYLKIQKLARISYFILLYSWKHENEEDSLEKYPLHINLKMAAIKATRWTEHSPPWHLIPFDAASRRTLSGKRE